MQGSGESLPSLVDPITYEVFTEPVVASDGHTYERGAILAWLQECTRRGEARRSPLTHEALTGAFRENNVVKWLVEEASEVGRRSALPASSMLVPVLRQEERKANEEAELDKEPLSLRALSSILAVLEPVRHVVAEVPIAAPRLVVLGSENAGKSALLERMTMLPLFPIAPGICTRMAVKVCLRQGKLSLPRVEVHDTRTSPAAIKSSVIVPVELAAKRMQRLMEAEVREENDGRLAGVCVNSVLVVHLQSPTLPTLDVIDLPGLVAHNPEGEPADMSEKTRRLVETYLDTVDGNAMFLVAIPANSDLSRNIALDVVQQRQLGHSSLVVLTKCDVLDAAADQEFALALQTKLETAAQQAGAPVVASMLPPRTDATVFSSAYERLKKQAATEAEWFLQKGLNPTAPDCRVSCDAVIAQIAGLYKACLMSSNWLTDVVERLQSHRESVREQEKALGIPRAHNPQRLDLERLLSDAKKSLLQTTPAHLAPPFCRVLSDSLYTGQQVWQLQAWEYSSMRDKICRDHCDRLQQQLLECETVMQEQLLLPLIHDGSPLKMGRFEAVISTLQTGAVRLIQAWRKQTSDQVLALTQRFYAQRPNPYIAVTHSLTTGSPAITLRIDYTRLQDEIVLELLAGLDSMYQRLVDRIPHDAHRWLESCAQHRKELLHELELLEMGGRFLSLRSAVRASSVSSNVDAPSAAQREA